MTLFARSGEMKHTRHEMNFVTTDMHLAKAYEYSDGQWQLDNQTEWRRYKTPVAATSNYGSGADSGNQAMIARDVAHLLSGSGQWRAPNPDYVPDGTMPKEFGMNYRWGPHGQHVVAEIISIYADGRQGRDWLLYIIHNPVLGVTTLEQTGNAGLYFRGQMGEAGEGEHVETGLIYFDNGKVKSVRDRNVMLDEDTRLARVDERDETGAWRQVRDWTWKQQPSFAQ